MGIGSRLKRLMGRLTGKNEHYEWLLREQAEIRKSLDALKKNEKVQTKAIEDLKKKIDREFQRRDDWEKREAETRRQAAGRQVWVIKCPAPEDESKARWGDYYYAISLKRCLERLNLYVLLDTREDWGCEYGADVVLVLRGCLFYRPDRRNAKCLYVMWNISHPDMVTPEEYELYDVVCVSSRHYAKTLQSRVSVPVLPLLQCTDTERFYPAEEQENEAGKEYIFIGNSRGIARSCVMWAIEDQLPLRIWGSGWNKILRDHMELIQAPFIGNDEIPELYRSAKATLNDHWKDMLDHQFINNRIFDALACGLPVISDGCEELKEIFPEAVLYYSSREEFEACVERIEKDYDAVKQCVRKQWDRIQKEYSFEVRARELVELVKKHRRQEITPAPIHVPQ